MIYEKTIIIPLDRVGVLIGKSGSVKSKIEKICSVSLLIDGQTGEIIIRGKEDVEDMLPFKAEEIVLAIGRGFSAEAAMKLFEGENSLHIIDLREFVGKSSSQIERIKGRIIGEGGRVRKNVEELSGASICVYGRTVAIIGEGKQLRSAVNAITTFKRKYAWQSLQSSTRIKEETKDRTVSTLGGRKCL
jgi:ribosomal RNA assembly protein